MRASNTEVRRSLKAWRRVDGLVNKYWISNPELGLWGAVSVWEDCAGPPTDMVNVGLAVTRRHPCIKTTWNVEAEL